MQARFSSSSSSSPRLFRPCVRRSSLLVDALDHDIVEKFDTIQLDALLDEVAHCFRRIFNGRERRDGDGSW